MQMQCAGYVLWRVLVIIIIMHLIVFGANFALVLCMYIMSIYGSCHMHLLHFHIDTRIKSKLLKSRYSYSLLLVGPQDGQHLCIASATAYACLSNFAIGQYEEQK